jgi:glyoxylase-like metal-dependent hydrolase (beta-lactamase superfamily II)
VPTSEGVFFVPEMSTDTRIRVFRRNLNLPGEFDEMEVDVYVIVTERFLVLLDTMLCPEDMAVVMQHVQHELPGRQLLVVNSHADWDHAWGNCYFTGPHAAPIIAQDYCQVRMQSDKAHTGLVDYQQRFPVFRNVLLVPPTVTFSDRFTIHGGDLTIELLPAPGHHPDHIAAWIPELRLLLAFDAIEKPLPCMGDAASVQPMFATLARFLSLKPAHVLCSHGKSTSTALVEDNLTYLREIESRSRSLLRTHQPTNAELEHAATLIGYPFEEVIANYTEPVDVTFYSWWHDANARHIVQWLISNPDIHKQE